jgi:hypothetical protein
MNGIRHPFTGANYEPDGQGRVRVSLGARTGLFTARGQWVSGDLREADIHLCGWVAGPRIVSKRLRPAH